MTSATRSSTSRCSTERPRPRPAESLAPVVLVVAGVAFACGAAFFVSSQGAARQHAADERARALIEQTRLAELARRQAAAARELEAARAAEAQAARELAEARAAQERRAGPPQAIEWAGTLDGSTLPGLRAGERCALRGTFFSQDGVSKLSALSLRCGVTEVFRRDYDPPQGASGLRAGGVAGSAARVYMFSFEDHDAAARGASTILISTKRHELRIAGAGFEPATTSVFLRDVSEPTEGPALGRPSQRREPAFAGFVERSVRVVRASGASPVHRGERCTMQVRPVWEYPESCRIALRCGMTWLYGAAETGYLTCGVRNGAAVSALDENMTSHGGDPRLRWEGSRVTVEDFSEEGGAWEVTVGW
ncbi:MAG: hypothetical protein R3A48_17525 [Polyangiales bacterium]